MKLHATLNVKTLILIILNHKLNDVFQINNVLKNLKNNEFLFLNEIEDI